MTLPTIQPVDWPDWGQLPTFSYASLTTVGIAAVPATIAELPAGYYTYITLLFVADGDGEDHEYQLDWMDATSGEGGSVVATRRVQVPFGYNVIVPMMAWAPVLRIQLVDSTALPTSVILYRALGTALPQNVGFPGGEFVLTEDTTVGATDTLVMVPNGCAPSEHQVTFATDSSDWNLLLRQWVALGSTINVKLYDSTATPPFSFKFIPPDGAWDLVFENNDATPCGLTLVCNRLP